MTKELDGTEAEGMCPICHKFDVTGMRYRIGKQGERHMWLDDNGKFAHAHIVKEAAKSMQVLAQGRRQRQKSSTTSPISTDAQALLEELGYETPEDAPASQRLAAEKAAEGSVSHHKLLLAQERALVAQNKKAEQKAPEFFIDISDDALVRIYELQSIRLLERALGDIQSDSLRADIEGYLDIEGKPVGSDAEDFDTGGDDAENDS